MQFLRLSGHLDCFLYGSSKHRILNDKLPGVAFVPGRFLTMRTICSVGCSGLDEIRAERRIQQIRWCYIWLPQGSWLTVRIRWCAAVSKPDYWVWWWWVSVRWSCRSRLHTRVSFLLRRDRLRPECTYPLREGDKLLCWAHPISNWTFLNVHSLTFVVGELDKFGTGESDLFLELLLLGRAEERLVGVGFGIFVHC